MKHEPQNSLVEYITEASKSARRIHVLYITFLAYCGITIVSTSDREIVLNAVVHLPIINSDISLNSFFIVAPLLSIVIFVYLQLYLHIIKMSLIELRAKHPNNRSVYPWMLILADDPEPGFIGWFQKAYMTLGIWWSLPLILFLFSFWIVKKHQPFLSYAVGLILVVGTALVTAFYWKYEATGQGLKLRKKFRICTMPVTFVILEILLLFLLIPWANEGKRFGPPLDYGGSKAFIGSWLVADLRREVLVEKPILDWDYLYWANLSGVHLEGADLSGAVLSRADLRRAHLPNAWLASANLTRANLSKANFAGAVMPNANLEGAILEVTNLAGALLSHVNLKNASLTQANLQGVLLAEANLQGANLYRSMLKGANLHAANLCDATLRNADLCNIVAQGADFAKANLEDAYLDGADLRHAHNLTVHQLSKARTLYGAKLDPELMQEVSRNCPHLLEKPNEEHRPKIRFDKMFPGFDIGPDWSSLMEDIGNTVLPKSATSSD